MGSIHTRGPYPGRAESMMGYTSFRKGMVTLSALVVTAATLGSGIWAFHERNAYLSDIHFVENKVQKGLDAWIKKQESKRCKEWLSEITLLEVREASGDLTDGQRDRLIWLRNQYEDECGEF